MLFKQVTIARAADGTAFALKVYGAPRAALYKRELGILKKARLVHTRDQAPNSVPSCCQLRPPPHSNRATPLLPQTTAGELRHPLLPTLEGSFEEGEGRHKKHFLVLPFYQHGRLRDLLDGMTEAEALTAAHARDAAAVFGQLLQVLSFLHSHRVVHRDVKPENIMLQSKVRLFACTPPPPQWQHTLDPAREITPIVSHCLLQEPVRIVLIDFGIAKDLGMLLQTATLAMTGASMPAHNMTRQYAPPENLREGSRGVAASTDTFAVGLIMLEVTLALCLPIDHCDCCNDFPVLGRSWERAVTSAVLAAGGYRHAVEVGPGPGPSLHLYPRRFPLAGCGGCAYPRCSPRRCPGSAGAHSDAPLPHIRFGSASSHGSVSLFHRISLQALKDLALSLTAKSLVNRPTADAALLHPFIVGGAAEATAAGAEGEAPVI